MARWTNLCDTTETMVIFCIRCCVFSSKRSEICRFGNLGMIRTHIKIWDVKKNAAKTAVACGYLLLWALLTIKAIRNQQSGLSSPLRPPKFRKSDCHKKRRSLLRRLYLLVCLFALFVCLLVCLFACSVLCLYFLCFFVCLCLCVSVCLSVRLSPAFVRLFVSQCSPLKWSWEGKVIPGSKVVTS